MSDDEAPAPRLRVVKGEPTAEELAVLTALVTAASGDDESGGLRARRGSWSDPSMLLRRQLLPGPNAWRSIYR
ncbi:MAG: acyl-CoA carboxylase subunit epsilon [Actinomycetota bacterium]|nr:acyl-CoA carboxylase subunit epsilon [Actinomycetota bacterium]